MHISRKLSQPEVQLVGQGSKTGDEKANLISVASDGVLNGQRQCELRDMDGSRKDLGCRINRVS